MVDFGTRDGHEQCGVRPALIIQNDVGNKFSPVIIVLPITDSRKRYMPTHVRIKKSDVLPKDSVILCEQVHTIDKRRFIGFLGQASEEIMADVDARIKISLGLAPVPEPKQQAN